MTKKYSHKKQKADLTKEQIQQVICPILIIPNDLHYSAANKWRQLFLRICKLSMQSANHHLSQHSRAQRRWQLENAQQLAKKVHVQEFMSF